MSVVIGIDVGGSTTKIVGFRKEEDKISLIEPQFVRANDPVTACYGAFGKFTDENRLAISDIERVMMTGVGSSYVKRDLYGLECLHVPEFNSIGKGGLYLSGHTEALVVSMGTGTALVHAKKSGEMKYLGGTGVGGGTIMGLSRLLLQADSIEHIADYADTGDLSRIDLRIGDLTSNDNLAILSRELTASNFGNVSDIATREDIALGILNMVFETIGMVSVFAAHEAGVKDIILTGNLTRFPHCEKKFRELNELKSNYGVNFVIPENSKFATVIGTALSGL
ncbi:MAG: type II pantothenate kinase [Clostridia bacterium]|nr:type II pantothenate kinase [Clostridia bacterium]